MPECTHEGTAIAQPYRARSWIVRYWSCYICWEGGNMTYPEVVHAVARQFDATLVALREICEEAYRERDAELQP